MNKKIIITILTLALLSLSLVGCMTLNHQVGQGATGNDIQTVRAWYVLFGLIPINDVDTHTMAGGAENYEIISQTTFIDALISGFTGAVTVSCQSVTVKK